MKRTYNTPSLRVSGTLVASTNGSDDSGIEGGLKAVEAGSVGFGL